MNPVSWELSPRKMDATFCLWETRQVEWFIWRFTTGKVRKVSEAKTQLNAEMHTFSTHSSGLHASHLGRNMCQVNNGGCSQLCFPTSETTRSCSCTLGYNLRSDRTTCEGKNVQRFLTLLQHLLIHVLHRVSGDTKHSCQDPKKKTSLKRPPVHPLSV